MLTAVPLESAGNMDQASNDLATLLVDEFEAWFRSLGADGFLPQRRAANRLSSF
jgi:hypothetical protein